jgi:RNA polymerase sigma-70 factor, ECF subfamily
MVTASPAAASGDLARRIAAGDQGAESELVAAYAPGLRFLLRRWTRDGATAEDLLQETLQLGLEKIRQGELRDPGQLAAFLRGLAKNLSIQLYRRAANRPERRAQLEAIPEPRDRRASQLEELLRREKARLVYRLLGELGTERDREVLARYYLREEPAEAIAADLGLSLDHFYRVLHRARTRYRRLCEERSLPVGG